MPGRGLWESRGMPGGGDLRTRAQRYHDALAEAMRSMEICVVRSVTSSGLCGQIR